MFRSHTLEPDMATNDGRHHAIALRDERSAASSDIPHDFEPALADPALEQFDRAMAMSFVGVCTWAIGNIAKGVKSYLIKVLELDGNAPTFERSEILKQQKES